MSSDRWPISKKPSTRGDPLNELSNLQELVARELARREAGKTVITIRRLIVAPQWASGHRLPNRVTGAYRRAENGDLVAEDVSSEEMAKLTAKANESYRPSFDEQPEDRDAAADAAAADTAVERARARILAMRDRQ